MVRSTFLIVASFCLALAATARADFRVDVAEAPTDNLALTVSSIQNAQQSVLLNIYELTSPEIADALINRIQAGVHVEILEEGQPVGGMSAAAKGVQAQIVQAMQSRGGDRFFVMTSKGAAGKRRFRFDHAKYAVIDDTQLLIGSENYSTTGNPVPGTKGNRGWEVLIHDQAIAQDYKNVFSGDATTRDGDVMELTAGALQLVSGRPPKPSPTPTPAPSPSNPSQGQNLSASSVVRVSSPDTSLSGLINLIDQAKTSIDIQQMTFDSNWNGSSNPLIAAIERAAARGVRVRVLLNDESVFNHGTPGKPKNQPTVDHLNTVQNVSALIANLKGMGVDYIHNKGVLVDNQLTLISSINWDENSIQHNREAAVVVTSPAVFEHYEALFARDWEVSGGARAVAREVSLRLPALSPESAFECPASLRVIARIGKLRLDADDDSFRSLDGATVSGSFLRERGSEGCVLSSSNGESELSRRSYVEIRSSRDGLSVTFEGFTSRGNKLYSVRAKVPKDADLVGSFDANVFNGSAAHEFLGKANLRLESSN